MVVDALDLCYTKAHVDTFVIISGDSDFSALVSKLRENNKIVIGVGVKKATSDLLISNCDEFIFYDDLARETEKRRQAKLMRSKQKVAPRAVAMSKEERRQEGLELVMETVEALFEERGEEEKVWGSTKKSSATLFNLSGFSNGRLWAAFSRMISSASANDDTLTITVPGEDIYTGTRLVP